LASMVLNGYFAACAATVAVSALKSVDLPTFGRPTMPHRKPMHCSLFRGEAHASHVIRPQISCFGASASTRRRIALLPPWSAHISKSLGLHGEMHLVLERRILALGDHRGVVRHDVAQGIDPGAIRLGEIAQHVVVHKVLVARMTDADAHAAVLIADMGR